MRTTAYFTALFTLLLPACSGGPGVEPEPLLVRKEVVFFASNRAGRPDYGHGMDVWRMNPDGTGLRQVTSFSEGDYWPADVSPDGKWLLFYRLDAYTFVSGIYLLDLTEQGNEPVQVLASSLSSEGSFFPDGKRFLFSRFVHTSDTTSNQAQLVYDSSDGSMVQVSPEGLPAARGRLSSDGAELCYSGYVEEPRGAAIYVANVEGVERRVLTSIVDGSDALQCTFTPSGTEIIFNMDLRGQNGYNLYRTNLATGERRTIRAWAKPGDIDYYAFPSVDSAGARVYVRVNGGARPDSLSEIASVALDGSGFRLLTQDRHVDDTPVVANAYVWE